MSLSKRPDYRPTGALGATLGISGLVLTGAGLWLWHRERSERSTELSSEPDARREPVGSAPVVRIDGSQVTLSWAGRF